MQYSLGFVRGFARARAEGVGGRVWVWAWVLGEHSEQGFVNALVGGLVGPVDMEALCGAALSHGIGVKAAQVCRRGLQYSLGFVRGFARARAEGVGGRVWVWAWVLGEHSEQGFVNALVGGLVGPVDMEALCGAALSHGIGIKAAQVCRALCSFA